MISLERSLLVMVAYLTIFYNIERVDLGQANVVDISSVIYVLLLLALLLILAWPNVTRYKLPLILVIWVVFYIGFRLAISPYYQRPLWGGVYTYLTVTETFFSGIGIILGYQVRRQLNDFREAVENLTLAGLSHRIQHKDQAYESIQKEFLRSRRHHYSLSVMVVQPDPVTVEVNLNRTVLEVQKAMMTRYAVTNIMRLASTLMRRTDYIVDQVIDKDSFVILLTDTDANTAQILAQRFQAAVDQAMGIKVETGLAAFPEEGLTFEDLVNKADGKIQGRLARPRLVELTVDDVPAKPGTDSVK